MLFSGPKSSFDQKLAPMFSQENGSLCVDMGFTRTFLVTQKETVEAKFETNALKIVSAIQKLLEFGLKIESCLGFYLC